MNKLTPERQTAVIQALCEGNSIRATCRITGTAKGTMLRLVEEMGATCVALHNRMVKRIPAKRVQCDEIWSFTYAKARNVPPELEGSGAGDTWTWMALDADTKLAIAYRVGSRSPQDALAFMWELRSRLSTRVQLTTDGFSGYLGAVEQAFGWYGADYAQLVKQYGARPPEAERAYSPPKCVGAVKQPIMGRPDARHISTSYIERQNLTMRMQMRRFTRLTNGFSKKLENHRHGVSLYVAHYNFCRVHQTLTKSKGGIWITPAMAAGLTDRVWKVGDLVALLHLAEKAA